MRKIRIVGFFLSVFFLLSSCNHGTRLSVCSVDYPTLRYLYADTFDYDMALEWFLPNNPYAEYSCAISLLNGELYVENPSESPTSFVEEFDNGYFVGLDLGEFDGWVKYYPYHSRLHEEDGIIVCKENCKGIIKVNSQRGYLLTGEYFQSKGNIYLINFSDDAWTWSEPILLDGYPLAYFISNDGFVYVVTDQNIVQITSNLEVEVIVQSELLASIGANSIVYKDDIIYCGSPMGIYSYSVSSNEEFWYPIHYDMIID